MDKTENINIPTYTISSKTIDLLARIAEKLGALCASGEYNHNLRLRKINRLRSIQSSLAIENNTLSLGQVSDIIEGKRVLGLPHEIQEVKNAYQAYENLFEYDPYKVTDFLKAHQSMTIGLVKDAGHFRSQGVGVFAGKQLIHAGANYKFVPQLITDLFAWAKKTDIHPLIKSSIVHFEIEFIHPFMDGNGRIGRLWQTLMLSKWNELFAWLPIETVIYENQQSYYDALQIAGKTANSEIFIEFMLNAILQTVEELPNKKITDIFTDINTDKLSKAELEFLKQIAGYLDKNGEITNYRAQLLTNKSDSSVKKYFAKFVEIGLLRVEGKNKGRKYLIGCVNNDIKQLINKTDKMKIILETERLILREMTQDDFSSISKHLQDEEVMYAYEHKFSDAEIQEGLDKQFQRYKNDGFGIWAVILKENNELIGQCGLSMQPCGDREVLEIGYIFQKAYWHKGYATEAAIACREYAFEKLNADEVFSIIRDNNIASQNVAKRNGMSIYGIFVKHYYDIDMPHYIFSVKKCNIQKPLVVIDVKVN